MDEQRKQAVKEENKRKMVNLRRMEEIDRIQKLNTLEEPRESEDHREPLSIETEICKKILLSWGGGSDGFKLYFSQEKELLGEVYFMADWGEYEESQLTEEEAQEVYDFYMGGYFE